VKQVEDKFQAGSERVMDGKSGESVDKEAVIGAVKRVM